LFIGGTPEQGKGSRQRWSLTCSIALRLWLLSSSEDSGHWSFRASRAFLEPIRDTEHWMLLGSSAAQGVSHIAIKARK
jgi:hypothetical protein